MIQANRRDGKGNGGDRMAIEEDQNGDFWSLLVNLYTVRSSL
jgi:hypothetical protein